MKLKRNTISRLSQVLRNRKASSTSSKSRSNENFDEFVSIANSNGFVKMVSDAQLALQDHNRPQKVKTSQNNSAQFLQSQLFNQEAFLLTLGERYAFAHWNIAPELVQQTLSRIGGKAKMVLRFTEQSHSWDVEIFDPEGNWYLKLNQPNQAIRFAVGLKNQQGFYPICEAKALELEDEGKKLTTFGEITKALKEREQPSFADFSFRYEHVLKKSLGPYFFDLLKSGRIQTIAQTSYDALFQDMSQLHKKRSSRFITS